MLDDTFNLRINSNQLKIWRAAAIAEDRDLSDIVRDVMDRRFMIGC